ncbi:tetratricopeptide repeat protein [Rhodoplanes azumiensis]|uniref:Tetratricopeptide repeat protein n=1 Tax=Rhodoplanes azumiensis TaxID=1897628 RepID=A0ABW5AJU9_9BRAD
MGQAVHPKYRAFLVHAPADEAWGKAIEGGLSDLRVPWALVGRDTPHGPVPKTIGPLVRFFAPLPAAPATPAAAPAEPDGNTTTAAKPDEKTAAPPATEPPEAAPPAAASAAAAEPAVPTLPDDMVAALIDARFLVVLCSPAAAADPAVNEAVRRFKGLGRGDRIIAVLVGGVLETDIRDLAPPALRRRIRVDGTVGDEDESAIAPLVVDARIGAAPRAEVIARLAAALLSLSFEEFRGPAERAMRGRRRRRRWLVTAAVLALVVGAGVAAWKLVLPNDPALFDATLATGTAASVRMIDMADRLGVPPRVVASFAESAERVLGDLAAKGDEPREKLRRAVMLLAFEQRLAALGVADPARRRTASAEALLDGLVFPAGMDAPVQREIVAASLDAARLRLAAGDADRALTNARAGFAAAERLAATDPASAERQRDLSRAATALGDALLAKGLADDALKSFRAAHAIRETLLALDPTSPAARRDLSLAYERIADVLVVRGAPDEALKGFRTALSLRLAAVDPGAGPDWQQSLAVLYNKIGDIQLAQGAAEDALGTYRAGLALQLAVADRADAAARRGLSVSYERIGDVLKSQRAYDDALAAYRASLVLREALAGDDPRGARWPRDLPVSQERIGDVLLAKGMADPALAAYRTALAVRERLAAAQPGLAMRREVAVTQSKIGDALAAAGKSSEAVASWRAALAGTEAIVAAEPGHATARWELAVLQWRLASAGDQPAERYRAVVSILRELDAQRKLSADQATWLPLAERELAKAQRR